MVEAPLAQAVEPPVANPLAGSVDIGAGSYDLTGGFPARTTAFVRGELRSSAGQRWTGEVNRISEFGDTGDLFVLGYETPLGDDWLVQVSAASSDAGATLPAQRLDFALGKKWLQDKNFVTTIGLTGINSKDAHSTQIVQVSGAYYFDAMQYAASIEAGIQNNTTNPGAVAADYYFSALSLSREKVRVLSLRLAGGQEAYLPIGVDTALVNFYSTSATFTWREWLDRSSGLQARLEHYDNPNYESNGVELSWFWEF